MEQFPSIRIDHDVVEKPNRVRVVRCALGASDLEGFEPLSEEPVLGSRDSAVLESVRLLLFDAHDDLEGG
jgi:mannose-1-phosphate guanylyltransferase